MISLIKDINRAADPKNFTRLRQQAASYHIVVGCVQKHVARFPNEVLEQSLEQSGPPWAGYTLHGTR